MRHMTPAQQRSELAGIIAAAAHAIEALDLYEEVYADEVSHEISRLLGQIGVRGHVLRKEHIAAHQRDAAFADSVLDDLERMVTAGGDQHEDWDELLDDWHKEDDK